MTKEERLQKLKYLKNPELEEEEILDLISSHIETIDIEPTIPEKGIDYFTEEDIHEVVEIVKGLVKDGEKGETGPKGEKGDKGETGPQGIPGKNGIDGQTPNIDKAIKEALSKIPKAEVIDTKVIIEKALDAFNESYKKDSLKLTALEKRLIRLGGGGASFFTQLQDGNINNPTNGQVIAYNSTTLKWENRTAGGGSGDVVGPVSATDNAIARYDTTTGKLIKDSGITIADGTSGTLSGTNSGDQLMYGTIAVDGQPDLDPTGTGDTLNIVAGTNMTITTNPGTNELTFNATGGINEDSFGIVVDGAGTPLTTGSKGVRYIPWDCTITGWDIRSDISGSCVFDIKRSGVSLAGTEKPTLSAASSNSDLVLSTWTTSLLTGDVIEFIVDSASTLTRATLTVLVTKI